MKQRSAYERAARILAAEAERDVLRKENARMREALDEIKTAACYASEENTDSREQMLLRVGTLARQALAPEMASIEHDFCPRCRGSFSFKKSVRNICQWCMCDIAPDQAKEGEKHWCVGSGCATCADWIARNREQAKEG